MTRWYYSTRFDTFKSFLNSRHVTYTCRVSNDRYRRHTNRIVFKFPFQELSIHVLQVEGGNVYYVMWSVKSLWTLFLDHSLGTRGKPIKQKLIVLKNIYHVLVSYRRIFMVRYYRYIWFFHSNLVCLHFSWSGLKKIHKRHAMCWKHTCIILRTKDLVA